MPSQQAGSASQIPLLRSIDAGIDASPNPTLAASIVMRDVAPGVEDHVCAVVALDNPAPIWASTLDATLSEGTHHIVVDRRSATTPIATLPTSCAPSAGPDETRLLLALQAENHLQLPAGVAFRIEAQQRLLLEMHYINVGEQPITISGLLQFVPAPDQHASLREAHSQFMGTWTFELPAAQPSTVQFDFDPMTSFAGSARQVFFLTSHTHKLGRHAFVERIDAAGTVMSGRLHESWDWSEPPQTLYSPALSLHPGERLRVTCEYLNASAQPVHAGPGFNDEMCAALLQYYDE